MWACSHLREDCVPWDLLPRLDAFCNLVQTLSCSKLTAPSRRRWPRALTAGVLLRLLLVVGCLLVLVLLLLQPQVRQLLRVSKVPLADVTVNCVPYMN